MIAALSTKKRIVALFGSRGPARIDANPGKLLGHFDSYSVKVPGIRNVKFLRAFRVRANYSAGQTRLILGRLLKLVRSDLYFRSGDLSLFLSLLPRARPREFAGELRIFSPREQRGQ